MLIERIEPQGFCFGVIRAIKIAKETAKENPNATIYIMGMLVHNRYVVEELNSLNLITLDTLNNDKEELLRSIKPGILILTAHGTDNKLKELALSLGFKLVDATCPNVSQTQKIIKDKLTEGYEILYLGKVGHPEAEAIISLDPQHIHLIDSPQAAAELKLEPKAYFITTQTTLSILDTQQQFEILKKRIPSALIQTEICQATTKRQQAILNSPDYEGYLIIGDPRSNNTKQLYKIAQTKKPKYLAMIESKDQLDLPALSQLKSLGITSGASTPGYLVDQIIETLKSLA